MRQEERFKISLYQNGTHSLRQGLEAYRSFANGGEPIQLKDAIMGIHHGVELLFKEMLVQHNQFLIFENLRDVAKKQKDADQMGLGIFFIENPPRTVSFMEAVSRVEAFLQPHLLDKDLLRLLEDLNHMRNQLEHYTIDANIEEIDRLIAEIRDPLLALFNSSFGATPELEDDSVEEIWAEARNRSLEATALQARVRKLMQLFDGQAVSGKLLTGDKQLDLPSFDKVEVNYKIPEWPMQRFDLFGQSGRENWAVEVKAKIGRGRSGDDLVLDLESYANVAQAQPWLVKGVSVSDRLRDTAGSMNIYLSDERDIRALERAVDPNRLF